MEEDEKDLMIRDLGMQVAQMAVDLAQTRAQLMISQKRTAELELKTNPEANNAAEAR